MSDQDPEDGKRSSIQGSVSVPWPKGDDERLFPARIAEDEYVFGKGRYQVLLLLFSQTAIFVSYAQISWPPTLFATGKGLSYWCRPPSEYSYMSTAQWLNYSIPRRPNGSYSHCSRYDRPRPEDSAPNTTEVPCEHWDYSKSIRGYSIVTEWDLVCNRAWLLHFAEAAFTIGNIVCVPLVSIASDRYGRWPVLHLSLLVLFCSSIALCFAETLQTFIMLRVFSSASVSLVELTTSVLLFESIPECTRVPFVALAICVPGVLAPVYVAALGDIISGWRSYYLALAVPLVLLVALIHLTGESLCWLIVHGKYKECEQTALWAAHLNNQDARVVMERLQALIDALASADKGKGRETPAFFALFTRTMRPHCVIIFGCWFFSSAAYFTSSAELVVDELHDLKQVMIFVNAIAMTISFFVTTTCGQRYPFVIFSILSCVCVAAESVLTFYALLGPLAWAIAAGYTLFNMAFVPLYILTMDIFPTQLRSIGFSVAYMSGSVGAVLAALVKHVETILPHSVKNLPRGAIAVGAAIVCLHMLFLPAHFTAESTEPRRENIFARRKPSMPLITPDFLR